MLAFIQDKIIKKINTKSKDCGLNIEDEIHFQFDCPKYSSIRDNFFNKIDNRIPNSLLAQIP